jgi:hypothetical protein
VPEKDLHQKKGFDIQALALKKPAGLQKSLAKPRIRTKIVKTPTLVVGRRPNKKSRIGCSLQVIVESSQGIEHSASSDKDTSNNQKNNINCCL